MKLTIKVKTNSKKNEVVQADDNTYTIFVTDPPIEGRANGKVIELLSEFFKKPKRSISIIKGLKSKIKIVEID